ncbi:hypothetical protein ACT6QH_09025 [Xanthobacter sp. TB0139]|uniref:hypothetical protein n=1 Tax=Xanthobacter sp. TB0139 TaxID=3459178 RepID=UPI004039A4F7
MKVDISSPAVSGLAQRIAARVLPSARQQAGDRLARKLAREIAAETGVEPRLQGSPERLVVRVEDDAVLARIRGNAETPGDAVLDRIRLDIQRQAGGRA